MSLFGSSPIHNLFSAHNRAEEQRTSIKQLVDSYHGKKRTPGSKPKIDEFTHETFKEIADQYLENNGQYCDYGIHAGWIEKHDLPADTQLFVRADIHGDLPTLIYHLRTAVAEGILDKNYRVKDSCRLIFLGDYTDRGAHSLEVLALLLQLKIENKDRVILIRGNHEDIEGNCGYEHPNDQGFDSFLGESRGDMLYPNYDNLSLLSSIYNTLPLAVYISQEGEKRQYTLFTHGLLEPYFDPLPLLEEPQKYAYLPVPIERELSHPIVRRLLENNLEQMKMGHYQSNPLQNKAIRKEMYSTLCARRIQELYQYDSQTCGNGKSENIQEMPYSSIYQWGDIGQETRLGGFENRTWHLSPLDVQCILYLHQSKIAKVKHIVRGHQHEFKLHIAEPTVPITKKINSVFITTLPVAMGSRVYHKRFPNQEDRVHLYMIAPKISQWKKIAYTRAFSDKKAKQSHEEHLDAHSC